MNETSYDLEAHGAYLRLRTSPEGACWNWRAAQDRTTPVMRHPDDRKKIVNVRRFTLQLMGIPMNRRLFATVNCGNLRCVNPEHLQAVTRKTMQRETAQRTGYAMDPLRNARISLARRRYYGHAPEVVQAVVASPLSSRKLAALHGVAQSTILYWKKAAQKRDLAGRATPWAGLGAR